jgi:8-oxo-dGTP pyrophosphatase MutT (NUDIX family)
MDRTRKVIAYITRKKDGRNQLLVLKKAGREYRDLQVPGGSINPGETEEQALLREIEEETGLTDLRIVRKLGQDSMYHEKRRRSVTRHFYLVQLKGPCPDRFSHVVTGEDDDRGSVYLYHWVDLIYGQIPPISRGTFLREICEKP